MELLRLDLAELVARLPLPSTREELAGGHGVAALLVDLPPGAADDPALGHLAGLPTVAIAVGDPGPALRARFDFVVPDGDAAALETLRAGILATPVAAVAAAVLLRGSEARTIDEGLAAESAVYSLLQAGPEFAAWRAAARPRRPAVDDDHPAVTVRRDGDVLHVTLSRPAVHNAFSARMRDGLCEALGVALADPGLRVVLDGAGPSFSSGGDLREFGSFPDPATAHVLRLTRSAGRLIAALRDRIEVRIHGACMGAGIELPSFAGRVVAHRDAVIALPELRLGLVPGAGGTVGLPRRIGRQRTAYLALTGARIDAATALAWGLVDDVTGVGGEHVQDQQHDRGVA